MIDLKSVIFFVSTIIIIFFIFIFPSQATGMTPLMLAAKDNRSGLLDRLIDLGSDVCARNNVSSTLFCFTSSTLLPSPTDGRHHLASLIHDWHELFGEKSKYSKHQRNCC